DGGLPGDHGQEHLRRPGRPPAALLPVEQGALGDTDAPREGGLRQPGAGADGRDIDLGHIEAMDDGPGLLALGMRDRFLKAPGDALKRFAHGQTPYSLSNRLLSSTATANSLADRLLFSFFAKTVTRNSGTSVPPKT